MRFLFIVGFFLFQSCTSLQAQSPPTNNEPLVQQNDFRVIKIIPNNSNAPLRMLIDTGVTTTHLSLEAARKLGSQLTGNTEEVEVLFNNTYADISVGTSIKLTPAAYPEHAVLIRPYISDPKDKDLPPAIAGALTEFDGVLGTDWLIQLSFKMDFSNEAFEIYGVTDHIDSDQSIFVRRESDNISSIFVTSRFFGKAAGCFVDSEDHDSAGIYIPRNSRLYEHVFQEMDKRKVINKSRGSSVSFYVAQAVSPTGKVDGLAGDNGVLVELEFWPEIRPEWAKDGANNSCTIGSRLLRDSTIHRTMDGRSFITGQYDFDYDRTGITGYSAHQGLDAAIINGVLNGSPTESAGLKRGDVIYTINGAPVAENGKPTDAFGLTNQKVGTELKIAYKRSQGAPPTSDQPLQYVMIKLQDILEGDYGSVRNTPRK